MEKVYSVLFKDGGKAYDFISLFDCNIDDYVIVETEKGLQYAKVCKISEKKDNDYKSIVRIATDEDKEIFLKNLKDSDKAFKKCLEIVKELDLKMKVLNAQYTFDRRELLFNFIADERIDFRELARKLASIYHTRIELRQIGARDKAREVGGIGVCGERLCCGRFLNQIEAVSMNMAKNQNLALNPSKINGACGRLLCCLAYEDANYLECSKGLPSVGDEVKTEYGRNKVVGVNILNRSFTIDYEGEKKEIKVDENR